MADIKTIDDVANMRAIAAAVTAQPGAIAIQNVAGTLKQVDDQGNVTSLGGGGGTCPVTLIPTQTIAVETDTVTFAVNGESGIFEFDIQAICGTGCTSAGGSIHCNFNAVTTNQSSQASHLSGTAGSAALTGFGNASGVVGLEAAAGQTAIVHLRVYTKSGTVRMVEWTCSMYDAVATNVQTFSGKMFWSDTSTVVTSIQLKDAVNKFFGAGTVISGRVYSLT